MDSVSENYMEYTIFLKQTSSDRTLNVWDIPKSKTHKLFEFIHSNTVLQVDQFINVM